MFDSEPEEDVAPGLDAMQPGPALGAFLAAIDLDRVPGYDRVVVLRALQRQLSHVQAQVYAAMASVAEHMDTEEFPDEPELSWEAAATEIRAALRLTRRAAEAELALALGLRRRLPRVWNALIRGSIDRPRARVIVHSTDHLDEATARQVVDAVIDDAPTLTTGQLAACLRRLAIEVDARAAGRRYADAVNRRRLIVEASPEGTAHLLGLDLPPHRVASLTGRIDRVASQLHRAGDSRTMDQLRADVFLDLLAGRHPDAKRGTVELRVDLDTLAGLAETAGEIAGYGPVIADIARQVADAQIGGEWRFTITDPRTGLPVHDGTTRRRPTAAQRRTVEARDRTCIFPGCRAPAARCDLDHRIEWARSRRTSSGNLDATCRHDHVTVRHRIGWSRHRLAGGDHLWISPLGHRYPTSGRPP